MPHLTGAEAVIATLRANGVDTIFGIPGVHTLPLYDSLRSEGTLRHVLARHEQGAGFMADGYARASGKVGVVSVITGPGVTNVTTPVADAYADSVPLLVIATSLPRATVLRPSGDLHELKDQLGVMESLAGWARAVASVEEIPDTLRDAFRALSSARPRGAYVQIPLDLLTATADVTIPPRVVRAPTAPAPTAIAAAARLLRGAQRPIIVGGAGVTAAGANESLARLATLLQAPVLLGGKSRDVLPSDFPLVVPVSGYGLTRELISLAAEADAALVVGSKLGDQRTGHGRLRLPPALVQIDIDPAEVGRRYPAEVGVVGDARLALDALIEALSDLEGSRPDRAGEASAARDAIRATAARSFGGALAYLDVVREALPREGVVVADMTVLGYASADYLPVYEPRTFVHASELCTIGCGLPLALGAVLGAGGRPVIALCGDGGFLLNVGEMATAVQERLPVIAIVFNDGQYTAVKDEQRRKYGERYIATDLRAPDYVAMARAFGAVGVRASTPAELRDAIATALHESGPTLIEVPLPPA